VARTGAGVVICPGTEANLGDGLIDLPGWLRTDTPLKASAARNAVLMLPDVPFRRLRM